MLMAAATTGDSSPMSFGPFPVAIHVALTPVTASIFAAVLLRNDLTVPDIHWETAAVDTPMAAAS